MLLRLRSGVSLSHRLGLDVSFAHIAFRLTPSIIHKTLFARTSSHKSRRKEYSPTLYHYDVKYLVHDNTSASSVKIIHSAKTVRPAFDCPFMRRTHAEIQFRYRCRSCRENLFLILLGANSRDLSGSITADKAGARGWRVRVDMHSYAACRGPVFRSPPECSRSAARSRSR